MSAEDVYPQVFTSTRAGLQALYRYPSGRYITVPLLFSVVYGVIGLGVSLFIGVYALRIWPPGSQKTWPYRFYQAWFNFFGSAAGWAAGYYVVRSAWSGPLQAIDLAPALVALVGMSGYLPATVNACPAVLVGIIKRYVNG